MDQLSAEEFVKMQRKAFAAGGNSGTVSLVNRCRTKKKSFIGFELGFVLKLGEQEKKKKKKTRSPPRIGANSHQILVWAHRKSMTNDGSCMV